MSEWRPIEEAPLDGTTRFLATNGHVVREVVGVIRSDTHKPSCSDPVYSEWWWEDIVRDGEPTHFMPLPLPPQDPTE